VGEKFKEKLGSISGNGRFGLKISHGTILAIAALATILFVAFTIRVLPLRWEGLTGGTVYLNEFDPYYQLSITRHMVDFGILSPYTDGWVNMMKWFPDGLDMSTSLPALPATGAVLYGIASIFGHIDLMTFLAILPAFIAALSCLIMYFVGKDMGGRTVGLFSALFLALAPSYLQRSSLGFYDTEVAGVLGFVLFLFFFMRCMDGKRSLNSSIIYSVAAGLSLAYFICGWGAAYYALALAALFVFVLVILRRYTPRMLLNYSLVFGIALMIGTKVPYLGLNYLTSGAIVPVAGVFVVLLIAELLRNNLSIKNKLAFAAGTIAVLVIAFIILLATGNLAALAGKFVTVVDPFIRGSSALVSSVAEQRITAWANVYTELGISILFFLVGLYFTLKKPTNRNIFLLIFGATSLYFANSMVRLLVLFAPAFAMIAAIGIIGSIKPFFGLLKEVPHTLAKSKRKLPRVSKEFSGVALLVIFMLLVTNFAFSPQTGGTPREMQSAYAPTAISASSLPLGGNSLSTNVDAWINAINWLNTHAKSTDVAASWWDYGNWLSDLGNVTTMADNTTVNATKIEDLGFAFMGTENQTLQMLSLYGQSRVKYIVVFEVLMIQQSTTGSLYALPAGYGDEGKWVWMARISAENTKRYTQDLGLIKASDMWASENDFGQTSTQTNLFQWNDRGLNCTIEEILYDMQAQYVSVVNAQGQTTLNVDHTATTPTYFKSAFISGLATQPTQYSGLIPLVGIYEINWEAYNAVYGK
jgi:dolichyl-diphosphooligosaccharide--protein glycosyltransferase